MFAFLIGAQALFGFGCGGEFPVAAASASERAESEEHLKGLRGRTTVLVFSMQARRRSGLCMLRRAQAKPHNRSAPSSVLHKGTIGFICFAFQQILFTVAKAAILSLLPHVQPTC